MSDDKVEKKAESELLALSTLELIEDSLEERSGKERREAGVVVPTNAKTDRRSHLRRKSDR